MTEKQNNASSTTTILSTQPTNTDLLFMETHSNLTISSMEVAEMMGKEHKNVLRDIRKYIQYLDFEAPEEPEVPEDPEDISTNNKLNSSNFFIKSHYTDSQGKTQPYYKITKKGVDFLSRRLTGQKGAKFTAKYINLFYELERANKIQTVLKELEQIQNVSDNMKFLVDSISEMKTELQKMQQLIATQSLPQQTIKPPTPKNTYWKSQTFKKLNAYIDYVNENDPFGVPVRLNNAIAAVIHKMENSNWNIDVNEYLCKYQDLFHLEDEPLVLDVVEYFPKLKQEFTSVLDDILDKYHISVKYSILPSYYN